MKQLPVEQIGYDPIFYPRHHGEPYWQHVLTLRSCLNADPTIAESNKKPHGSWRPFPPVIVVKRHGWDLPYMILDGAHRTGAFREFGLDRIWAEIETVPKSKWLARATEFNVRQQHCNLSDQDRASIAERLSHEGMTDTAIAGLLHVTPDRLEKIRTERVVKLTAKQCGEMEKDGDCRVIRTNGNGFAVIKSAVKEAMATNAIVPALRSQKPIKSLRAIHILDECIAILQSKVLDPKDVEIESRLRTILELIGPLL